MKAFVINTLFPDVEALQSCQGQGEIRVGIFGHCVANSSFLRNVLCFDPAMTWKLEQANASFIELLHTPEDGWFLCKFNVAPHKERSKTH